MANKTILLCLNETARLPQLLAAARYLGVKFNAHIRGLYVIPGVTIYPSAGYGAGPDIYDGNRVWFQDHQKKTREDFEAAMKADSIPYDFQLVDSAQPNIINDVLDNGYDTDLIVASNLPRDDTDNVDGDFIERLVLSAGRPVLVLPPKGEVKLDLSSIVVAWNDSRESARAVFDALPFLQKAKRVRLVSVDSNIRGALAGATVAESLDRHGVKPEIASLSSDGAPIGEVLLRAAKDENAGLLVLGAYGHGRFAELVFGGATRHVLKNQDVPLLMSH
jgi:nucleotide-binding universal stress UspA family protein